MKFLVIGCGSIGERHIKNLNSLSDSEILAYDIDPDRLHLMKKKYNADVYKDVEKSLDQNPDAVLVCTPPNLHIPMAMMAINHNAHVFIEKPISHNLKNIDDLILESKKKKLVILVGYNIRFHPGIKLIKKIIDERNIGKIISAKIEYGQYLPDWRPQQNYRESYSAKHKLGGGIILDASHEIDYARWILGDIKEVFCFADKISNLDIDVEDTAEILLKLKSNAIAEIHLDAVQRKYSRNCKIIGDKGTVIWDFQDNTVKLFASDTKQWKINQLTTDINDTYINEIIHFINCINDKKNSFIDGNEGKKSLEIALAAKKSAKIGSVIKIE